MMIEVFLQKDYGIMLQVVNKISTTGGVEKLAKMIQSELGGTIYAFEPGLGEDGIIQPKRAISIRGQYFPLTFAFWREILSLGRHGERVILHQPTMAALLTQVFFSLSTKNYVVFKHARGDGVLGFIIEMLTKLLAGIKRNQIIVTSRHELKFSRLTARATVVNFPLTSEIKLRSDNIVRQPIRVILVGRLVEYKGILELVDEIISLNDAQNKIELNIVGEGPLRNRVMKKTESHPFLKFHGFLSDRELNELFLEMDALVVASRSRGEAFNLTQLDAISQAKPIILRRLASGTQDTAWHSKTILRYDDGSLGDALKLIPFLSNDDFAHDKTLFENRYNRASFFKALIEITQNNEPY